MSSLIGLVLLQSSRKSYSLWPLDCSPPFSNMAYRNNDPLGYGPEAALNHDWVHIGCIKNSSPNRPPSLNCDNISFSEAGTPVNNPNTAAQVHALRMNMNNLHIDELAPSSYTSSNDGSIRAPDGLEIKDPANNFLHLTPATGLGEMQYHRRASFEDVEDQLVHYARKDLKSLPQQERSFHAEWKSMDKVKRHCGAGLDDPEDKILYNTVYDDVEVDLLPLCSLRAPSCSKQYADVLRYYISDQSGGYYANTYTYYSSPLVDYFWTSTREHENCSLFRYSRATISEESVPSRVDILSLSTPTMSTFENQLEPLRLPYSTSFFASYIHALSINHYLLGNEGEGKGISKPDRGPLLLSHGRDASSKTAIWVSAECVVSTTAFGVAMIFLRTISSYLVSHNEYNPEPVSHLNYQQTQSSRQLENNTNNRARMPHTPTSSTPLSNTMNYTTFYSSPDFDMDPLENEWSESQILFGQDWSEMEMAYSELNPTMAQAEFYPPSEFFDRWGNLQSDTMFDSFSSQDTLPQSWLPNQVLSASWNYPTPVPSTPSADSGQHNDYYTSNGIPEISRATSQPLPRATYTCETCGVTYPKKHLLNDHKKIHNPSLTCPVQRCSHRAAKSRDMERHVIAKHPDYVKAQALPTLPRAVCPVSGCKNGRRGFARKDHLQRHLKKFHPGWHRPR